MSAVVEYHFSMVSPWAFIGHDAFHKAMARRSVTIDYKPIALLEIFEEHGTPLPPKRHPSRQKLRWLELQRWRERRELTFNLKPAFWPFAFATADKMVIALAARGDDPAAFMGDVFNSVWSGERNLADEGELKAAADRNGFDGAALLEVAKSAEVDVAYKANTRKSLDAGNVGAPAYFLNGEIFWGQDRIGLLEDALSSGRAPFKPVE